MLALYVYLQNFVSQQLRRDDRGATAVEYGLILVFIAGVVAVALPVMGRTIMNAFNNVIGKF